MCDSCEVIRINGIVCHEQGCPDSWKGKQRECKECGNKFTPTEKEQYCCSGSCSSAYYGVEYYDEDETYPDYDDQGTLISSL